MAPISSSLPCTSSPITLSRASRVSLTPDPGTKGDGVRLVHLSDIHFSGYSSRWEPNIDQRRELVRDLARLVNGDGPVDGVLVGGDIAKTAAREQYEVASEWLDEVCRAGKCPTERVWVVPGNHDIDRSPHDAILWRPYLLSLVREALASNNFELVDRLIRDWFLLDASADRLFESLASYNEFATTLNCPTTADLPSWTDLTLDLDGLQVQLTGLNSVLFSDTRDYEHMPSLALGLRQCEFDTADGRLQLALVHHPPEWIGDWDHVARHFFSRVHLVLFGHEHRFETHQPEDEGAVIVRAGAVGPEEGGLAEYVPSWNLITLRREDPCVEIMIEPRVWSPEQTRFVAHSDGTTVRRVRIDLSQIDRPSAPPAEADREEANVMSASPLIPGPHEVAAGEPVPSAIDRGRARQITVKFLKLPKTRQRAIAKVLGVDDGLSDADPRRVGSEILVRVRHANMIGQLVERLGDA